MQSIHVYNLLPFDTYIVKRLTYSHKPAHPAVALSPHRASFRPSAVSFCNITRHCNWSPAKYTSIFTPLLHVHHLLPSPQTSPLHSDKPLLCAAASSCALGGSLSNGTLCISRKPCNSCTVKSLRKKRQSLGWWACRPLLAQDANFLHCCISKHCSQPVYIYQSKNHLFESLTTPTAELIGTLGTLEVHTSSSGQVIAVVTRGTF